MLNNLINRHDVVRLYRRLRRGEFSRILEKLQVRGADRVLARWSELAAPCGQVQWGEIPAVRRRWLAVASDGGEVSFPEHAARTWLAGQPGLRALSLGCGTGGREAEWARLGVFAHITGVDVSAERIGQAARQAEEAGLADVLSFRAAGAREVLREGEQFDVVLALQSLHHFDHAGETMELIWAALGPAGLLPALHRHFTIAEAHPYGSILHLALQGIARNFLGQDAATAQAVQQCLAAEDEALARLGHDFLFAICTPRDQPAADPPDSRGGLADILSFPPRPQSSAPPR